MTRKHMCKHSLRLIIQRIDGGISDFWSGLLMDANIQSEHRLWIEYFHDDRNADRSSRSEYNAVNASLSSVPCDGRDWEPIYTDFSFQMRQTFLQVLRVLLLAVVLIPLYIRNCDTKHLWWKIFLDDLCTFISWTTCLLSFYNFCIASSILQTVNSQMAIYQL